MEAEAHSQFYNKKSGDFGEMSEDNFVHTLSFTQNEIEAGSFCLDDIRTTVSRELSDINESQNDQSEIAEQEEEFENSMENSMVSEVQSELAYLTQSDVEVERNAQSALF